MEIDQKQALKRARITSIILALAFVIAVLGVIFGMTQSIQADRNLEMASAFEKMATAAQTEAERQHDIANEQTALMLQREKELERLNKNVQEALEGLQKKLADCGKKK